MTDIMQAMNAMLVAQANIQKWESEFMASWYEPIFKVAMEMAIEGARKSPNIDKSKLMSMLSPQAQKKFRGE
jgi:hypothetical protein